MSEAEAGALGRRVEADIVAAMKARDAGKVEALRMVKAALKNREIDKRAPLTDGEAQAVLTTMIKQRRESIEQFTRGNRPELAAKEASEIGLIEQYLPKGMSEAEMAALVDGAIGELEAAGTPRSPKAMGAAMKAVNERIAREGLRADGCRISELVKAGLAR